MFKLRKRWKVNSGICQKEGNVKHKMTVTSCVGGEDFTCNDGTCVRINKVAYKDYYDEYDGCLLQRCNLVTDCPDQSDEADCDLLQLDDDYRNELLLYLHIYLTIYYLITGTSCSPGPPTTTRC